MNSTEYDVIVIGAGINGSWSALHLAKQGFKTVLIDQVYTIASIFISMCPIQQIYNHDNNIFNSQCIFPFSLINPWNEKNHSISVSSTT